MSERSLQSWREEFPALTRSTYMVSHSLGAMPRRAQAELAEFGRLWVDKGITAWDDWIPEITAARPETRRPVAAA